MTEIASTPTPPYYTVIFTSIRKEGDYGYSEMAQKMEELAKKQPGYLGFEAARDGLGIAISYWQDLDSIKQWKDNLEHSEAQKNGREKWYSAYTVRIGKVEKQYSFEMD